MTTLEQRMAADVVLEKLRGTINLYKVIKSRHPAFGGTSEGKILDASTARTLFAKHGLAWTETDTGILGLRRSEAAGQAPSQAG